MTGSPAHAAATAFTRGALFAIAGVLLPSSLTAMLGPLGPGLPYLSSTLRVLFPLAGFYLNGIAGAAELPISTSLRPRVGLAFLVAGLVVPPLYGSLQGLSGFENPGTVVGVMVPGFMLGFGATGLLTGWLVSPSWRTRRQACAGFTLGGAVGGTLALCPFFLAVARVRTGGLGAMIIVTASTFGAFIVPSAIGGAWLAHALDRDERAGASQPEAPCPEPGARSQEPD